MWKHRFLYGLSYTAIEHTIDAEGHDVFHGIILQKNKSELKIKNTFFFKNRTVYGWGWGKGIVFFFFPE